MLELRNMNLEDAKAQWKYAGLVCAGDLLFVEDEEVMLRTRHCDLLNNKL